MSGAKLEAAVRPRPRLGLGLELGLEWRELGMEFGLGLMEAETKRRVFKLLGLEDTALEPPHVR